MKQLAVLAPALALLACAPAGSPEAAKPAAIDVKTPYAFELQLTLTPRTVEKLEGLGEMIAVSAAYWGEPTETAKPRANPIGRIDLGADEIKVQPASRLIAIPGAAIDPKALAADIAGVPQVLVNVVTARTASKDNLINCGIYEGPISMAQQKPVDIKCDLIEPSAPEPIPTQPN